MSKGNSKHKDHLRPWQFRMHEIIYEADTPAGKTFDITLMIAILLSIAVVMLESVDSINKEYGHIIRQVEWVFTIIFSIEYICRIISIGKPLRYITSFYGLIDLFSILPTYLSLFIAGSQSLLVIRTLRLLRVFRIFKLARFIGESRVLGEALFASRHKITVFLGSVFAMVIILGTLMYLIEDPENGFTSIPRSIYWAIVTLTTVGYGDIAPQTVLGQTFASFIMILGYAIIAVPTGIVSVELAKVDKKKLTTQVCPQCASDGHAKDAKYCRICGAELNPDFSEENL